MKDIKLIASALAIASLVACGGGGGGSASSTETFAVTGSAAKGILKNADVQAYELVAGELVKYGTPTTTNGTGDFKLDLPKTTNPVVIKITTNKTTKMLDETSVVSGKFAEVDAPQDLVLRTMVPDLTAAADAQANPFTEMAIAGALAATDASGTKVTLTKDVLLISKEAVKTQLGINPFALKAVDADSTTATADQKTLMTLLTGVAKSAKDDAACSTTCQVTKLGTTAAIKYDKSTGKGNFKDASAMAAASNSLGTKAATVSNPLVVTLRTYVEVKDGDVASGTELAARDSFETFIKVMRDGATAVGTTLDASKKTIDARTQGLTFKTAKAGVDAFNAAAANCRFPDTKLVCEGSDVSGGDGTYALTYKSGDYTNTVSASGSVVSGVGTLTITGKSKAISDKAAADLSISAVVTGLSGQNMNPDSVKLNISLTGYDDEKALPVTVKLTDLTLKANQTTKDASVSGGLSISNSYNDKLSGTVAINFVGLGPDSASKQAYTQSATLNVTGYGDDKTLLALDIGAKVNYDNYKPWETESENNAEIATANVSIAMVNDGVKLDITGNKTGYNKNDLKVVFKSGANSITATGVKGSNKIDITSSSGDFKAELTKGTDGKTTGVIKQGSVQVGTIEDGMIKVNGQELSLK